MNGLISHIEYLLTQHDCVIIPGFGGFVLRNQSAIFAADGNIIPPCKVVAFNPALTHNDGLLANSISLAKHISFNEAMILIESEVHSLQMRLRQGLTEELNSLGTLYQGKEGELVFVPSQKNIFDLSLYGFSGFTLPQICRQDDHLPLPSVEPHVKADVVMVPVNMRVLRRVSAVAALIIGLLFVSHPLEYGNISQHHASMISADLLTKAIVPHFAYYQDQIEDVPEELVTTVAEPEMPVSQEEIEPTSSVKQELAEPSLAELQSNEPVKRYYIVIGSFPNLEQAEKRIAYFSRKGLTGVQYLLKDNKYRLYVNTFADKTEANDYLGDFRSTYPELSDAWLLAHINR